MLLFPRRAKPPYPWGHLARTLAGVTIASAALLMIGSLVLIPLAVTPIGVDGGGYPGDSGTLAITSVAVLVGIGLAFRWIWDNILGHDGAVVDHLREVRRVRENWLRGHLTGEADLLRPASASPEGSLLQPRAAIPDGDGLLIAVSVDSTADTVQIASAELEYSTNVPREACRFDLPAEVGAYHPQTGCGA